MDEKDTYSTNDLTFTAYLIAIHQYKLIKAKALGRSYVFILQPGNGNHSADADSLKVEFLNSDIAKFDNTVQNIKRILFSDRESNSGRGSHG